ncbi:MAG: 6-phosphogluconolactonase, partial [Bacteroidota bacterium]
MPTIHIEADPASLAQAFAAWVSEQIPAEGPYHIALSGGSTPKLLFAHWAAEYQDRLPWNRIHFWWGDERCVPPNDADSNYRMTKELLLDHVSIPVKNIHRVEGEIAPDQAAVNFAADMKQSMPIENGLPKFDLIILGMGADGHTASIFPHEMELLEESNWTAVATHPESGQKRVTLTGSVLNAAGKIAFLVAGASKLEKVTA